MRILFTWWATVLMLMNSSLAQAVRVRDLAGFGRVQPFLQLQGTVQGGLHLHFAEFGDCEAQVLFRLASFVRVVVKQ